MKKLTPIARKLRNNCTDTENKLWEYLRAKRFFGFKFRRQEPIGKYIADFVCHEKRLIIECDGGQHLQQIDLDKERDSWLEKVGYRVLRFWDNDVLKDTEGVLEKIREVCEGHPLPASHKTAGSPSPFKGEGKKGCPVTLSHSPLRGESPSPFKGEGKKGCPVTLSHSPLRGESPSPFKGEGKKDVVIIGAGPAGLSAAIQATRQGLSIAIFEKFRTGGQVLLANWIENFPGFPEGIAGHDLAQLFVDQAKAHGVVIRHDPVKYVSREGDLFSIRTGQANLASRTVIVAAGLEPKRIGLPGAEGLRRRKLFAYVDPLSVIHAGKRVLIIGSGDAAFDQALNFARKADSVRIAMRRDAPRCIPILIERAAMAGIEILPRHRPLAIRERGEEVEVEFEIDGKRILIYADVIDMCIGKERKFSFLPPELAKPGAEGMFWAGDCIRGDHRHIAIATGDGTEAAMKVADFVNRKP